MMSNIQEPLLSEYYLMSYCHYSRNVFLSFDIDDLIYCITLFSLTMIFFACQHINLYIYIYIYIVNKIIIYNTK